MRNRRWAGARINDTPVQEYRINSCGMPNFTSGPWKNKSAGEADGVKSAPGKAGQLTRPSSSSTACAPNTATAAGRSPPTSEARQRRRQRVVQPVGGPASFYADWDASNFNAQPFTYQWRCVITRSLIRTLDANGFRVGNGKYAIMGLSPVVVPH